VPKTLKILRPVKMRIGYTGERRDHRQCSVSLPCEISRQLPDNQRFYIRKTGKGVIELIPMEE
jgi:hypothetical protein